jgi:hypothetical protein
LFFLVHIFVIFLLQNVSNKDRNSFDKMTKLFSDDKNWERLRKFTDTMKQPCIPHLGLFINYFIIFNKTLSGIFLTDLVHIDVAHPHAGTLTMGQRELQMNNILRVLSDFQFSDYCMFDYVFIYSHPIYCSTSTSY